VNDPILLTIGGSVIVAATALATKLLENRFGSSVRRIDQGVADMAILRSDNKDLDEKVDIWKEKYWKLYEECAHERIENANVLMDVSRLQREVDRLEKEQSQQICPFSGCPLDREQKPEK